MIALIVLFTVLCVIKRVSLNTTSFVTTATLYMYVVMAVVLRNVFVLRLLLFYLY